MKALLTLNIHIICEEDEVQRFKQDNKSLPSSDEVIVTRVVDEELIDDNIDAVKLITDRYKDVGI